MSVRGPLYPTHELGKETTFLLKTEAGACDFPPCALFSEVRKEVSGAIECFALTLPPLLFPLVPGSAGPGGLSDCGWCHSKARPKVSLWKQEMTAE